MNELLILIPIFFMVSALYASVGHGGASGYLAIMALASIPVLAMKPTALTLNLVVSLLGTIMFFRAGHFAWRLFWMFSIVSIPFAYLGGRTDLSPGLFKILVAAALLFATIRLFITVQDQPKIKDPPIWAILLSGSIIGLFSGLIGVGGGIFLTPLLLICGWANIKTAAAVSAPFIFVNSAAGLLGHPDVSENLIPNWPWFAGTVVVGGFVGARWGSSLANPTHMRPVLAAVLVLATLKLVIT